MKVGQESGLLSLAGALTPEETLAPIARLGPDEAWAAECDWGSWAHDGQRAPAGDWSTWVVMGGRGFGKTRAGGQGGTGLGGDGGGGRARPRGPAGGGSTGGVMGGRGFGKTRAGAQWVTSLVEDGGRGLRIALVGAT